MCTDMSVIQNETPEPRKPRTRHPWRDWVLITVAVASVWYGVCELIQLLIQR